MSRVRTRIRRDYWEDITLPIYRKDLSGETPTYVRDPVLTDASRHPSF